MPAVVHARTSMVSTGLGWFAGLPTGPLAATKLDCLTNSSAGAGEPDVVAAMRELLATMARRLHRSIDLVAYLLVKDDAAGGASGHAVGRGCCPLVLPNPKISWTRPMSLPCTFVGPEKTAEAPVDSFTLRIEFRSGSTKLTRITPA